MWFNHDATIKAPQITQSTVHIAIVMLDQRTLFGIVHFNALSLPPLPCLQVIQNKVSIATLIFEGEPVKPKIQT